MSAPILRYFSINHLKPGPLRQTSALFAELAVTIDDALPDSAEKSVALRKLLESKDAAVRAALDLLEDGAK
ncbi:MAG: hypothetical protein CVT65_14470 [Actinobacteria bacterium HGW-Actinobacteria-5]|nr:MAG: hypothetical protein CVT65_14470 [Actinobacteria bacterium HGW-Actinobacteria-5]